MIRYLAFCVCAVIATADVTVGQEANFRSLWTTQKDIEISHFRPFWVFSGFSEDYLKKNKEILVGLLGRFNQDFLELSSSQGVKLPEGFEVAVRKVDPVIEQILSFEKFEAELNEFEKTVRRNDIVFFYMLAHGNADGDKRFIVFEDPRNPKPREEIKQRLRALQERTQARFVVFITDTCSTNFPASGVASVVNNRRLAMIWRSLYFGHHGFVDVSTSKLGQEGRLVNGESMFLRAFNTSLSLDSEPSLAAGLEAARNDIANGRLLEGIKALATIRDEFARIVEEAISQENQEKDGFILWKEFVAHLEGVLAKEQAEVMLAKPQGIDVDLTEVKRGAKPQR